jgi:hypothetical protein
MADDLKMTYYRYYENSKWWIFQNIFGFAIQLKILPT